MKSISIIILLISLTVVPEWLTDFETARQKAASEHKLILLNFSGSDWCGPCITLKEEVFNNEAFQLVAEEKLILVRADFPRQKKNQLSKELKEHNERLAEKYNPHGKFPLTLLLDEKGNLLKSWDTYAYGSQEKMINEVKAATSALH